MNENKFKVYPVLSIDGINLNTDSLNKLDIPNKDELKSELTALFISERHINSLNEIINSVFSKFN